MRKLKKNRLLFSTRSSVCSRSFRWLKSKNVNYIIMLNFFMIIVINWFRRVQKSSKKSYMSWRRNRLSSLLQIIILLTHWFWRLMQMLFFLCCLMISEQILTLKKTSQHLLSLLKMLNRFLDIFTFIIIFLLDKIIIYFVDLIFC